MPPNLAKSRNRAFTAPKVRIANPQISRGSGATARLQTDARPSRDGSERLGPGTQAYGQI
jgi:hypothetical protein